MIVSIQICTSGVFVVNSDEEGKLSGRRKNGGRAAVQSGWQRG